MIGLISALKNWKMRCDRWLPSAVLMVCIAGASMGLMDVAIAAPLPATHSAPPAAEALFEANCAACHANGGNIVRRGKNLKQKALSRNGYDSAEAIGALVTQGKGAMPAYADRLSEDEIEAIAQYILARAEIGW